MGEGLSIVGSLVIAPVINLLYEAYGFQGTLPRSDMNPETALAAPQATLMTTIAQGIFDSSLNLHYIDMGMFLGIIIIAVNVLLTKNTKYALPLLAVGMRIYLPPSLPMPIVIGAIMIYLLDKNIYKKFSGKNSGAVKNLNSNKRFKPN